LIPVDLSKVCCVELFSKELWIFSFTFYYYWLKKGNIFTKKYRFLPFTTMTYTNCYIIIRFYYDSRCRFKSNAAIWYLINLCWLDTYKKQSRSVYMYIIMMKGKKRFEIIRINHYIAVTCSVAYNTIKIILKELFRNNLRLLVGCS